MNILLVIFIYSGNLAISEISSGSIFGEAYGGRAAVFKCIPGIKLTKYTYTLIQLDMPRIRL